jgi:hypothetical protein
VGKRHAASEHDKRSFVFSSPTHNGVFRMRLDLTEVDHPKPADAQMPTRDAVERIEELEANPRPSLDDPRGTATGPI